MTCHAMWRQDEDLSTVGLPLWMTVRNFPQLAFVQIQGTVMPVH